MGQVRNKQLVRIEDIGKAIPSSKVPGREIFLLKTDKFVGSHKSHWVFLGSGTQILHDEGKVGDMIWVGENARGFLEFVSFGNPTTGSPPNQNSPEITPDPNSNPVAPWEAEDKNRSRGLLERACIALESIAQSQKRYVEMAEEATRAYEDLNGSIGTLSTTTKTKDLEEDSSVLHALMRDAKKQGGFEL